MLDADITFAAPPSVVALFRGALDAFRPPGAPLWKGCEKVLEHVCENRVTVCAWHHLRGIHLGRIRAHGTAPHAIIWEIGLRCGRPPLLRTLGDRYLS